MCGYDSCSNMASGRAHAAPNTVRSPQFASHLARETYLTLGDITHMASLIISEGNHRRSSSLTCTKLKQRWVSCPFWSKQSHWECETKSSTQWYCWQCVYIYIYDTTSTDWQISSLPKWMRSTCLVCVDGVCILSVMTYLLSFRWL